MTLTGVRGDNSVARNFGLTRQISRSERAPVWPIWVVAFAMVGVTTEAIFLHR